MYTIKLKRGTSARWARHNPLLADGEPGFETDSGRFKIGDGSTLWNDLPYFAPGGADAFADLEGHINDLTPHPAYDDGPSFVLLYENAKV